MTGYVLSLLLQNKIDDDEVAQKISSVMIDPVYKDTPLIPGGASQLFEAFKKVLPSMDIDCEAIGEIPPFGGVCVVVDDDTAIIDLEEPTILSKGLYITTTNVGDR